MIEVTGRITGSVYYLNPEYVSCFCRLPEDSFTTIYMDKTANGVADVYQVVEDPEVVDMMIVQSKLIDSL